MSDDAQVALRLLTEAIVESRRSPTGRPTEQARERATLAWELMHLEAIFGAGRLLPDVLPDPDDDEPLPGPAGPIARELALHTELLTEIVRVLGDPNPQPSAPSVLTDTKIRLAAALALRSKVKDATERLDETIAGLERARR